MFLKTNSTVRKKGIFDSLWGGIQRCVIYLSRAVVPSNKVFLTDSLTDQQTNQQTGEHAKI